MSHLFETGFKVRTASWHGLENVIADYPRDGAHALELSGLGSWEPEVVASYFMKDPWNVTADDVVLVTLDDGRVVCEDVSGRKVLRTDTQAVLGSGVSPGWTPVTNATLVDVAEAIVEQGDGNVHYETMGSLDGGRKVYCTVFLDEPWIIGDDDTQITYPFLAITNAHDGSGSFYAMPSTFEVVCANTAKLAELTGERLGRQFKFNHTGNVMDRIEEAKQALAGLRAEAAEVRKLEEELFALPVDLDQVHTFAQLFEPTAIPTQLGISEKVKANASISQQAFLNLYESSPTIDGHRGTALGVFRAATEYIDHVRGARSKTSRAYRSLLKIEPLKFQAVTLAREVATGVAV